MTALSSLRNGTYRAAETIYQNTIRDYLPRRLIVVDDAGIILKGPRLLDISVGAVAPYEQAERDALQDLVEPGDHVIVIGAGWGSTTVLASRLAGPDGRVDVWEAVPEMADLTRWAVEHNVTSAPVTVHESAVSSVTDSSRERYGAAVNVVAPTELPTGDVWMMDCEGAEDEILTAADLPERVAVEVHESWTDVDVVTDALGDVERREKNGDADDLWIAVVDGSVVG